MRSTRFVSRRRHSPGVCACSLRLAEPHVLETPNQQTVCSQIMATGIFTRIVGVVVVFLAAAAAAASRDVGDAAVGNTVTIAMSRRLRAANTVNGTIDGDALCRAILHANMEAQHNPDGCFGLKADGNATLERCQKYSILPIEAKEAIATAIMVGSIVTAVSALLVGVSYACQPAVRRHPNGLLVWRSAFDFIFAVSVIFQSSQDASHRGWCDTLSLVDEAVSIGDIVRPRERPH